MGFRLTSAGGWAALAETVAEDRTLAAPATTYSPTYYSPTAPLNVSTANVLRVSDAWACVSLLANSISTLPLHVFRKAPQGRIPAGPDSRAVQLLQRPSPGSTGVDLVSHMMVHLAMFGECFLGKYRADREIAQLGLIHPESVAVELQGQRVLYTLSTLGGQVEVGPSDVLHIKGLSLDGLRGLSPVKQAATALGLNSSLQRSAKVHTEQGSRPSGILTAPNGNSETLKHVAAGWAARHAGVENMHRVAVVSGDVKFEPIAFSQSDQKFLGQREMSTREVARVFGIPSWAIGGSSGDSLTYSNTTEQNRALVTHALRPWATRVERALSTDADLFPGGLYCQFDFDGLLRASPEARAQQYTAALDPETGWMHRSEMRALEDLPPETTESQ